MPPREQRVDAVAVAFLAGWLAVAAPYLGLLAGRPPSGEYRDVWSFAALGLLVAGACWFDRRRVAVREERRLRGFVGAAFAVWAAIELGEHLLSARDLALRLALSDSVFVVFYVLMSAAALVDDGRELRPAEARLRRLHRAEVGLFVVGLCVYLVVLPARFDAARAASPTPSATLYVTLDLLLVGLFAWRGVRADGAAVRRRWELLTLAALLFLLADGLYLASTLGRLAIDRFPALDLLWYLPHLAVVAAVRGGGGRPAAEARPPATAALPVPPGFVYAALVPVVDLGAELLGAHAAGAESAQHRFALLLSFVLGGLAWLHQRRQREAWDTLRREVARGRRRLAATEQLEAIGRLAAGVAHDFNNLLTVVVGRADLIRSRGADGAGRREVEGLLAAAHQATTLTSELLALGERGASRRQRVELDSRLDAQRSELVALAGEGVVVLLDLAAGPAAVELDPGHLDRALAGLVAHASGALSGGGRLMLATRRRRLAATSTPHGDEVAAGDYVSIMVRDDGPGMDAEALARIFEPYFTSRDLGRGAGLGLAAVRGLVRQNGGQIVARSEPDGGSSFEMLFPEVV